MAVFCQCGAKLLTMPPQEPNVCERCELSMDTCECSDITECQVCGGAVVRRNPVRFWCVPCNLPQDVCTCL